MRYRSTASTRSAEEVDAFLAEFFGDGNEIDLDHGSEAGVWLQPSIQALRTQSDVAVVLPRRHPLQSGRLVAYVLTRDTRQAMETADLLRAFVGPSYSHFDGRSATLDASDPVDRAVTQFCGNESLVYTIFGPTPASSKKVWQTLRTMQTILAMRPARLMTVRRPLGKLLGEFDAAVAAGASSASANILDHITVNGGLSGTNLAYLRIKRLARLGRHTELLRSAELSDVVVAQPPAPVADYILTALFTTYLVELFATRDLDAARATLIAQGAVVPALAGTDHSRLSGEALSVLALEAQIRGDHEAVVHMLDDPALSARIRAVAPALLDEVDLTPHSETPGSTDEAERVAHDVSPDGEEKDTGNPRSDVPALEISGWPELITALAAGEQSARTALSEQQWRDWPAPASIDQGLARTLAALDDDGAEKAWSVVGAILDADGYDRPAAATARELVTNALAYGRYAPGDLAAVVALVDIVLRGAPVADEYSTLLDDLRGECSRWVSAERATVALDLADQLVRHACPSNETRLGLALELISPLHGNATRLATDQGAFARQLSAELNLDLTWPATSVDVDDVGDLIGAVTGNLLLYSLDEAVLSRTSTTLATHAPNLRVVRSSDKVGNTRLRQHARNADIIVLATRCATHAATGFIQSNARKGAVVIEADGSGSASLLRAAYSALNAASS